MANNLQLKKLTTAKLWVEFKRCLETTAEDLRRLAEFWVELKERGQDLSEYTNPMLSFMPEVASGQLSSAVLLKYTAWPEKVAVFAKLVPEDQAKLAKPDVKLPVVMPGGGIVRMYPSGMSVAQTKQVCGDGRIRTVVEQKPYVPAPRPGAAPRPIASSIPVLVARALPAPDTDPRPSFDIYSLASIKQRQQIQRGAKNEGMTVTEYILSWGIEVGAITEEKATKKAA